MEGCFEGRVEWKRDEGMGNEDKDGKGGGKGELG